jgi:predicted RNase H-like HicB family nuclease
MKWRVVLEPDTETGDLTIWHSELSGRVSARAAEQEALDHIRGAIELYPKAEPSDLESGLVY